MFFFKTYLGGPKEKNLKKKLFLGGTGDELFAYIFGIYIKFGYKNPSILTPYDLVDVAT